ncbi:hypothetical protein ACFVYA_10615 [Amycolatopsis sp. NPDC058278]|uniref:hypothetical protein n=1 Tax=Amycolatopsis sp. NPDC058278 TaxID=3346417 RepID=UPI0036D78319
MKALKEWLRRFVGETPLEEVAAAASYSVSTVSNALGGTELPRLRLVQSIAAGVGAPLPAAHRIWWEAASEEFTKNNPAQPDDPVADFALQLRRAMLRSDLGKTEVLRRMVRLSDAESLTMKPMSRATLCRLLDGDTLPNPEQMNLFLRVIGIRDEEIRQLTVRFEELIVARARARSTKRKARSISVGVLR